MFAAITCKAALTALIVAATAIAIIVLGMRYDQDQERNCERARKAE